MIAFPPSSSTSRLWARPRRLRRRFALSLLLAATVTLGLSPTSQGFEIVFDYSYDTSNFFGTSGSVQRTALESAASYIEAIIADDLNAITPGGSNTWSANFFDPSSGSFVSETDLTIPADSILVYVGARNLGGALGLAGPGGLSASGSSAFLDNVVTRGEGGTITPGTSGDDTEVAPWGGSVAFDNSVTWNFDTLSGSGAGIGEFDFFTTATHELVHVLGVGTVDSFDSLVNGSNEFTGTNAVAEYGGNVPMTGTDHLGDGTMSTVFLNAGSQEVLMSTTLGQAERRLITDLDVAVLDDIGWDTVPEPGTLSLLGIAGVFAGLWTRRRRSARQ